MADTYAALGQDRVEITVINTWTVVNIPVGARYPWVSADDITAVLRVSTTDSLNASTEGVYIPATGGYAHEGINTSAQTIYVASSVLTSVTLLYTKESA